MDAPYGVSALETAQLARLLCIGVLCGSVGRVDAVIAGGTLLDWLACTVGQAEGDARTGYAVGDEHRMFLDELRLHWRCREIDSAAERFDNCIVCADNFGGQLVISFGHDHTAPHGNEHAAVGAFLQAIEVQRADRLAIQRQLNLLVGAVLDGNADRLNARIIVQRRVKEFGAWG